ncbi:MAG: VOC family protein [Granulosicoccus sp.]
MPAKPTIRCKFDHLVVCASDLQSGVLWFEQHSGIKLPFGGNHPLMATHNHLTALSADSFLEIIATDPQASAPLRARWFELDSQPFKVRLGVSPQLTTWVVGCADLDAALDAAKAAGADAGEAVELTRGDLQWRIGLRADGTLAYDGVFPILIQWPQGLNPVSRMQDQGLRLNKLQLQHPQVDSVMAALQAIGADHLVDLVPGKAALHARMSIGGHHFPLHNDLS